MCFDAAFRVTLFNKKREQNVCWVTSQHSLPTIMWKYSLCLKMSRAILNVPKLICQNHVTLTSSKPTAPLSNSHNFYITKSVFVLLTMYPTPISFKLPSLLELSVTGVHC